jgi:hydroxymethylglutaryl-CoA reductase
LSIFIPYLFANPERGLICPSHPDGICNAIPVLTNFLVPLAIGTVGGVTSLHPMVKMALEILGKPSAHELMQIVAVAGLAQNFAALRSLTTTGIQEGHMKMHLNNILNQFQATAEERKLIINHFEKKPISHASVVALLDKIRGNDTNLLQ